MYKALLEVNTWILLVLLVVNALMVSLAMSLIFKPFLSSNLTVLKKRERQ
ncbi:hypothetical protein JCM19239_1113 [Vibrio variabilis]|uniref:Uncharacterized protein n=1 Tax=Vibrio variabilis TaxID=990271 RepID=A0ABQ0JEB8_9VIBR|nr:hypothetical protein JCM19239_1113 [Vibrio variabilis]